MKKKNQMIVRILVLNRVQIPDQIQILILIQVDRQNKVKVVVKAKVKRIVAVIRIIKVQILIRILHNKVIHHKDRFQATNKIIRAVKRKLLHLKKLFQMNRINLQSYNKKQPKSLRISKEQHLNSRQVLNPRLLHLLNKK